jgi:hypothetical protein
MDVVCNFGGVAVSFHCATQVQSKRSYKYVHINEYVDVKNDFYVK